MIWFHNTANVTRIYTIVVATEKSTTLILAYRVDGVTGGKPSGARVRTQSAMVFPEGLGYLAASLTTLSFVPQAVRVIRTRDTRAISLVSYAMFCAGIAFWLAYGIAVRAFPIVAANAITLVLASTVLVLKIRFG